ncbi:MAG: DUF4230 domain-containing protein [Treponema sp.]|nr:DUF4230 domain-containing protein [Candidatus Treponema equifaecale]
MNKKSETNSEKNKAPSKPVKSEKTEKKAKSSREGVISRSINKILFKIAFILVLVCGLAAGGYFGFQKLSEIKTEKKTLLAMAQLEKCGELVTIKNTYSDVVTVKKTRIAGLAKSFSIVRYTGILRAGIKDISLAEVKVSNNGKKIEVVLPECEVLGNDISGIEVFDEARSIFVAVTLKEIVDEINLSREVTQDKLVESGILEEAKTHSVLLIKNILAAAGFSDISVSWKL